MNRTNIRSEKQSSRPGTPSVTVWTISNAISVFRLLLAIPVFLLLARPFQNRWWVLLLFLVAYLSDLADGFIARKLNQMTDVGRIIDPLADKVFVILTVLALLFQRMIPTWFASSVIARDMMIFGAGMYLKKKTGIVVQSNLTGKAAVVSIGVVLIASLFRDGMDETVYTTFLLVSLGLMVASLTTYTQRFMHLNKKRRER